MSTEVRRSCAGPREGGQVSLSLVQLRAVVQGLAGLRAGHTAALCLLTALVPSVTIGRLHRGVEKGGNRMRRILLILGIVGALAAPVAAQARTTVSTITLDDTFPLCNGDLIHLSGPLRVVISEATTPSGGYVLGIHFQPQGVTGVDLVTGTVFHATGLTRDISVNSPPGGFTETFVNQFHIQATGGAESYLTTELFHITVTPDGTVRVFFDNISSTC
jgi:hypothetical protein